jgi:hypothetical protein
MSVSMERPSPPCCESTLVVAPGDVVIIDEDAVFDCVDIGYDAHVLVNPGRKLILTGCGPSRIDELGTIKLTGDGSELRFDERHRIAGLGAIWGQHHDARISIASGKCLTSKLLICGAVTFTTHGIGSATFSNQDMVWGVCWHGDDQITFGRDLVLRDAPGSIWRAGSTLDECEGYLAFQESSTDLQGTFILEYPGSGYKLNTPATEVDIETTGDLHMPCFTSVTILHGESSFGYGRHIGQCNEAPPNPISYPGFDCGCD